MSNAPVNEVNHKRRKPASAEVKAAAVLRVLKGEDRAKIAEELEISSDRLARWEKTFVGGGTSALVQSSQSSQSHHHRRKLSAGIIAAVAAAILGLVLAGLVLYRIIFQPPFVPPPQR